MSKVLKRYQFVIENFDRLPKELKVLLSNEKISEELLKCVCEISYNILKKNVSVSSHQKRKLTKYKNVIKIMSDRKCKVGRKRKILKQFGRGFLPVLFSIIAPILGSLLSK